MEVREYATLSVIHWLIALDMVGIWLFKLAKAAEKSESPASCNIVNMPAIRIFCKLFIRSKRRDEMQER